MQRETETKTLMRPEQAGKYLGLSPSTLAKMRMRGDGPPYSKAGARVVLYRKVDLDDWLQERTRISTSQDTVLSQNDNREFR